MYVGPQSNVTTPIIKVRHGLVGWILYGSCMRLYKKSRVSFVERVLVGFEEEMFSHCIGTIPELFDGNPPYHARGAYPLR